jgi:RNA polymerase sigma factor (TIGR02999 family)
MDKPTLTLQQLVRMSESGDATARNELFALLYTELRRIAKREAHRFGNLPSLNATALLHEAFLDLNRSQHPPFTSQGHFLGYAARVMRGLVIDHLRKRNASKHGAGLNFTNLKTGMTAQMAGHDDVERVGVILDELAVHEPDLALVVDLQFFGGFKQQEIADLLDVGLRTVQRRWQKAQLLLSQALQA